MKGWHTYRPRFDAEVFGLRGGGRELVCAEELLEAAFHCMRHGGSYQKSGVAEGAEGADPE